jgi:hypothetical protein
LRLSVAVAWKQETPALLRPSVIVDLDVLPRDDVWAMLQTTSPRDAAVTSCACHSPFSLDDLHAANSDATLIVGWHAEISKPASSSPAAPTDEAKSAAFASVTSRSASSVTLRVRVTIERGRPRTCLHRKEDERSRLWSQDIFCERGG